MLFSFKKDKIETFKGGEEIGEEMTSENEKYMDF